MNKLEKYLKEKHKVKCPIGLKGKCHLYKDVKNELCRNYSYVKCILYLNKMGREYLK